jgi:Transglutaminase-like enzymes, putative cysteine proteases
MPGVAPAAPAVGTQQNDSGMPERDCRLPAGATRVRRCEMRALHLSDYRYERPPRDIVTYLRLIPPAMRGCQRLLAHSVTVAPLPHADPRYTDDFGNSVVEIHLERVDQHLTIAVSVTVATASALGPDNAPLPTPIPADTHLPRLEGGTAAYVAPTPMTAPDDALRRVADEVAREVGREVGRDDPFALVARLADRVHDRMTFQSGATIIGTTAAEAWAGGKGVCQDYTHVLCALCRHLGIPARYVSGCVPGEGVMHAWAEALLTDPATGESAWYAIDPTYNQWVHARYVSIASGRDYHDITPTSGRYFGGPNVLKHGTNTVLLSDRVEEVSPT